MSGTGGFVKNNSAPGYVSFQTLLSAIDGLAPSPPPTLSVGSWPKSNRSTATHLMQALKFLGMLGEGNAVTTELEGIILDPETRLSTLRACLKKAYADILPGESFCTPRDRLEELFRQQTKLSGHTLRKAVTFFLHAAEYCELRPPEQPVRRRRSGASPSLFSTRQVNLSSGGVIKIDIAVNLFELPENEREFVDDLVKRINTYSAYQIANSAARKQDDLKERYGEEIPF